MRVISNILSETTNLAHSGVKMGIRTSKRTLGDVTRLVWLHLIQLNKTRTVLSKRYKE